MAVDNPTIFCGDDAADLEMHFVEICGLMLNDYFEDERILTREVFQEHYNELLDFVSNWAVDLPEHNNIAYQVLGAFILKLGVGLDDELKRKIIDATNWEIDRKINWPNNWVLLRKFYLQDLREKIRNHKYRHVTHIINLGLMEDKELRNVTIGIDQYKNLQTSGEINKIQYVNLDSYSLAKIPDSVFDLNKLRILSFNGNKVSYIPRRIQNLTNLEELHLRYNNVEELPDVIGSLENLRVLDLAFNQFKAVPKFILEKGDSYYTLFLHNNPIEIVPSNFKRFVKIDFSFMNEDDNKKSIQKPRIKWYI